MDPLTILVTGSTDGIGRQTALELAAKGHRVIVHGRDEGRCRDTAEAISKSSGGAEVDRICADLAAFDGVRKMADTLLDRYAAIDVLINNAGLFAKHRQLSENGFEMTLAVNHLAPFLLTGLLLDALRNSPAGRIVNVSSMVHAQALDLSVFEGKTPFDGFEAYSQTKLCGILFTIALAARMGGSPLTVNCLHPGVINTKLLRENWHGGSPVTEGAKTSVYLATAGELKGVTGRYFVNRKPVRPSRGALDPKAQETLWQKSENWTGFTYPT